MEQIFYGLALLACPLGMGAMMWLLMRSNKKQSDTTAPPEASEAELAQLRAEVDQLRASRPPALSGTSAENRPR